MSTIPLIEDVASTDASGPIYPDLFTTSADERIEVILAPVRMIFEQGLTGTHEYVHLALAALVKLQELNTGHGYGLWLANELVRETMTWLSKGAVADRLIGEWNAVPRDPDVAYPPSFIKEVLSDWPVVMPGDMKLQLMLAFMDLENPSRPPSSLFRRPSSPANLQLRQDAEGRVLRWIEYHRGKGKTAEWARDQAADAVGVSASTIRSWETEWRHRAGEQVVNDALATARRLGEENASGERRRKFIEQLAAEGNLKRSEGDSVSDSGACLLIELFGGSEASLSDSQIYNLYAGEAIALKERPDEPLKIVARIWRRTKSMQGPRRNEESGPAVNTSSTDELRSFMEARRRC